MVSKSTFFHPALWELLMVPFSVIIGALIIVFFRRLWLALTIGVAFAILSNVLFDLWLQQYYLKQDAGYIADYPNNEDISFLIVIALFAIIIGYLLRKRKI